MEARIVKWIETVLSKLSGLETERSIEILHACGAECCKSGELYQGALKLRKEHPEDTDPGILLQQLKSGYYDSENFYWDDAGITLILEECTCYLVKAGVGNSTLCDCTVGYSIKLFETLFRKPVEVELKRSILRGDPVCEQKIKIAKNGLANPKTRLE